MFKDGVMDECFFMWDIFLEEHLEILMLEFSFEMDIEVPKGLVRTIP